ncbi:MAG: sugar ABC transporter permease [Chloroflexi bacterium]|nr:sugar ABC transporter permease [Chloroflexota bacterium]
MRAISLRGAPDVGRTARLRRSRRSVGILFVLPALIVYGVFVLYPFLRTAQISLTDWNGIDPVMEFIGLDNYVKLFSEPVFWTALGHNLYWILVGSIGAIGLGLVLALIVSTRPVGFHLFRTIFFMPQVLGPSIVGVIWLLIYAPRRGFLYQVGEALDIAFLQRSPLANTQTALTGVLIASIWASIGFFFVIFLAGLQNVDRELLDAAKVDGANGLQRFRFITIPQLSHVITMVIALGMINSLKVFDIVWAMTEGGPATASELLGTYAYREAFKLQNQGYGSAIVIITSVLALSLSFLFIKIRERREA